MTAPMNCRLVDRWRIVEADLWDRDYLDLVGPATMTIGADGGVRLKRPDLRKLAIRRTSGCGKFAPRGEGGGAIELEIVTAVEMAFLVEVVVN